MLKQLVARAMTTLIAGVMVAFAALGPAHAVTVRQGVAALQRRDYNAAAAIFNAIAPRGDPNAQAYLALLYSKGFGVPQNYTAAAYWYRRAAEQGHSGAQYQLGLLYDRGFGVPQDVVEAEKWLILSTAGANGRGAEDRARIRDAVRTKMTRGEIAKARLRAVEWGPHRER
jgi:TPR repeat protein